MLFLSFNPSHGLQSTFLHLAYSYSIVKELKDFIFAFNVLPLIGKEYLLKAPLTYTAAWSESHLHAYRHGDWAELLLTIKGNMTRGGML